MRARLFIVIALLSPLHSATAAVTGPASVTVRVYSAVRLDTPVVQQALAAAQPSLASANVDVTWLVCSKSRACNAPLRAGELVVRLVRGGSRKTSAAAVHDGSLPLGDAMIDASGSGVLATVYVDRVQQLAASTGADLPTLLGRTIAHELGHLLLGARAHSKYGLMRSFWSREEIARGRRGDWTFTNDDARAIHARRVAGAEGANIVWGTE